MLRISICHRSSKMRNKLLDYIARISEIEDDYITECFADVKTVQQRIEKKEFCFDLLLLEMEANGIGGLFLAKCIREANCDVDIIFIAENMNFVSEAFHYHGKNYIVEPVLYELFSKEIVQYLWEREHSETEYIIVQLHGKKQMLSLKSILCFVSEGRKIGVVFSNSRESIWFYEKLNDLEKRLEGKGFVRCHQSYLVNARKVESVGSETLQAENSYFPISRKYQKSVNEYFERVNV